MVDLQSTDQAQDTTTAAAETPRKKGGFWAGFLKFLYMGGFMVILILGVVLAVVLSSVFQCK